jgi:hypothetical protein
MAIGARERQLDREQPLPASAKKEPSAPPTPSRIQAAQTRRHDPKIRLDVAGVGTTTPAEQDDDFTQGDWSASLVGRTTQN